MHYLGDFKINKYKRKTKTNEIDVYDILVAFNVTCPAIGHAIKKLLCPGTRGHKDKIQDIKEAYISIERALQLQEYQDNIKE